MLPAPYLAVQDTLHNTRSTMAQVGSTSSSRGADKTCSISSAIVRCQLPTSRTTIRDVIAEISANHIRKTKYSRHKLYEDGGALCLIWHNAAKSCLTWVVVEARKRKPDLAHTLCQCRTRRARACAQGDGNVL
eukprot:3935814-Rhodomonas_salina.2